LELWVGGEIVEVDETGDAFVGKGSGAVVADGERVVKDSTLGKGIIILSRGSPDVGGDVDHLAGVMVVVGDHMFAGGRL